MATGTSLPHDAKIKSYRTDANFYGKAFFAVKRNGDNDCDLCGAGELAFGVLDSDVGANATGEKFVAVQIGGEVVIEAGGTVTAGTLVMSDSAGNAVTVTDGNYYLGQALTGGADGAHILVAWGPGYFENT